MVFFRWLNKCSRRSPPPPSPYPAFVRHPPPSPPSQPEEETGVNSWSPVEEKEWRTRKFNAKWDRHTQPVQTAHMYHEHNTKSTRNALQLKPTKNIFIFHILTVVLSLEKGGYHENSHILNCYIKIAFLLPFMCMDLPGLAEKRITQWNSHTDMTLH